MCLCIQRRSLTGSYNIFDKGSSGNDEPTTRSKLISKLIITEIKPKILSYALSALIFTTVVCLVTTLILLSHQPYPFDFKTLIQHMTNPAMIMSLLTVTLLVVVVATAAIVIYKLLNLNSTSDAKELRLLQNFFLKNASLVISDEEVYVMAELPFSTSLSLKTNNPNATHKISVTGNQLSKKCIFDTIYNMLQDDVQIEQLVIYDMIKGLGLDDNTIDAIVRVYIDKLKLFIRNYRFVGITNDIINQFQQYFSRAIYNIMQTTEYTLDQINHYMITLKNISLNLLELLIGFSDLVSLHEIQE